MACTAILLVAIVALNSDYTSYSDGCEVRSGVGQLRLWVRFGLPFGIHTNTQYTRYERHDGMAVTGTDILLS